MGNLLFSPNGRIGRNRFWQGMVILTVLSVLTTAGSVMVNEFLFGLLGIVLIYPYICVYGKRLHDIGTTAWWVLGILVANVIVSMILNAVLEGFFATSELRDIQIEVGERLASGDLTGALEGMRILAKALLPLNIIVTVLANAVIAIALGLIPGSPRDNKHGPALFDLASDHFQ